MKKSSPRKITLLTDKGKVQVHPFCGPAEIRSGTFDPQFTSRTHGQSLFKGPELLVKVAGQPGANVVLALTAAQHIIGYGVLAYPGPEERWAELGPQIMVEVRAIEVCPGWRSRRLAAAILETMLDYRQIEEKIVYMVGYSWTWDLAGTRMTPPQYRQMLLNLFQPQGFREYRTNEPNLCLKPENLFMCRVGRNISPVIISRFKWLRFGLSPWTWNVNGR